MNNLISKLSKNEDFVLGGMSNIRENISSRKHLVKSGIMPFPTDYLTFLKKINGVCSPSSRVFGIELEEKNSANDAIRQNEKLNRHDKNKVVVLGYNMFDYLVFDNNTNYYQLRDKEDDAVIHIFNNFEDAVSTLLGVL